MIQFRDVKTSAYFKYRGKKYMKCSNSYDKYDTDYNCCIWELWPQKKCERFFKNSTKVIEL